MGRLSNATLQILAGFIAQSTHELGFPVDFMSMSFEIAENNSYVKGYISRLNLYSFSETRG